MQNLTRMPQTDRKCRTRNILIADYQEFPIIDYDNIIIIRYIHEWEIESIVGCTFAQLHYVAAVLVDLTISIELDNAVDVVMLLFQWVIARQFCATITKELFGICNASFGTWIYSRSKLAFRKYLETLLGCRRAVNINDAAAPIPISVSLLNQRVLVASFGSHMRFFNT